MPKALRTSTMTKQTFSRAPTTFAPRKLSAGEDSRILSRSRRTAISPGADPVRLLSRVSVGWGLGPGHFHFFARSLPGDWPTGDSTPDIDRMGRNRFDGNAAESFPGSRR